ncbi:hypothetical protein [Actinomadura sp. 6N118]
MLRIGIILGSTRPGRNGEAVAQFEAMVDQLVAWSRALAPLRVDAAAA